METLIQNIDSIIIECNKRINENILGINYLEKLKYYLIDSLKLHKISSFEECKNTEITKIYGKNHLLISIENFSDSLSKIKNVISNDYLCIVLIGGKFLEIYSNSKHKISNNLNLFPFTGIVLSQNTVVNESISKETILLNIYHINEKTDIEN